MFKDEKLEMKVGIFIGAGVFLMFLLVFSISDIHVFQKGYDLDAIFDFVNGISDDAPVRLAGVNVGEVKGIDVFYDEKSMTTKVRLDIRIFSENTKIQEDSVARINTLGLLGERYLEISPGVSEVMLKHNDLIKAKNPINVGEQMESMQSLVKTINNVAEKIEKGEGTLGKLIKDDTLYEDLTVIFGRLRKGEGTIGKLLVEDKVYNDMEDFVSDIKAHPWKLLSKPSRSKRRKEEESETRGTVVQTR